MGRGRQKAKATKQARDMKYYSPATDLSALQAELTGGSGARGDEQQYSSPAETSEEFEYAEYADRYADYSEDEDDA